MKHWSAEFQPRSLCSFGDSDGGPGGDAGGGPVGDGGFTGGDSFFGGDSSFSGDTSGFTGGFDAAGDPTASTLSSSDFFGDTTSNFQADTGGQFFGDTTTGDSFPGSFPTGGDSWTGADTTGGFFDGGPISGPQGWGDAGWSTQSNAGLNAAVGPPGWATSDFGGYGVGGPTGTGFGPGAGPAIGGPNAYSSAPGISGFPGDFGAPPGGTFGMPTSQGDVGPQAGPGMPGGPGNVGNAEPGFMPAGPEIDALPGAPTTVPTDQRGENFFGPPGQQEASSFFGPSQAQAASRGTDADIIATGGREGGPPTNQETISNAFDALSMGMTGPVNNPALAEAFQAYMNGQGVIGPTGLPGFEGPTPGAQQGFTGMSPAQAAAGGPFTGQAAAFGPDSTQGKGDRGDTAPMVTAYPGVQPGAQNPTADPALQAALEARADDLRGGMLAPDQPGRTAQTDTFDSRFGNLPLAQPQVQADTFDSRFGNLPPAQEQNQPATFDSRFGDWGIPTSRSTDETPAIDLNAIETIARSGPELTTGLIGPLTQGLGRDAAPIGLWGMMQEGGRPGGSPFGLPSQTSGRTSDSGRPGLSITVGNNQFAGRGPSQGGRGDPGYYNTGGRGIAPGAKGAEYGGVYGPGVATGRPGTNTFGVDSRSGAFGFYDPATGLYFR